jgi:hypothetical protein
MCVTYHGGQCFDLGAGSTDDGPVADRDRARGSQEAPAASTARAVGQVPAGRERWPRFLQDADLWNLGTAE